MKLVTCSTGDGLTHAGVLINEQVLVLRYPTLLELLRDPVGLDVARAALNGEWEPGAVSTYALDEVVLLAPIPDPPTLRDFYAFEQHVKTGRAKRGLEMLPQWYEIPTFYFSNTSEIAGPDAVIPYPLRCQELDFELEIACVIGREGKNIVPEEASDYIAGYTILNDWSARDFQRKDMLLNLGPGKGKDFATSLGPCLVTPDELTSRRSGTGINERYTMTMLARINGQEVSRGNFRDIYYSFPQIIAHASSNARLRVGDVLGSGTVGTGCLLELGTTVHRWLQPDDVVELEIEGIGILRNRII